MFKDYVYKAISSWGHRWTPNAYMGGLELSYHLRELFALQNIACVVDVGANDGHYRNFLRRRCSFDGLIISFEPVRSVYDILQEQAKKDPHWLVINCALGAKTQKLEINVMADTHFSSFLNPSVKDNDKPDIITKNVVSRREEVQMRTLEAALAEIGSQQDLGNIYLKMDTQGYDFEVLRGAGAVLSTVAALQTELAIKPLYDGMVTFTDAMANLSQYGFEVTGLFPVTRDQYLRVIEFDCVATRSPTRK